MDSLSVPVNETKVQIKKPHAPSRHRFEEDVNNLKALIEIREQQVQQLLGGENNPYSRLQTVRESKETANKRRRSINDELEVLNKQINAKRDLTIQMRSKLQYQSEQKIDEVVRNLETQLQRHQFRLSEERKLVAEIDRLKRSKKSVQEYNVTKEDLEQLRQKQQQLREERDNLVRETSAYRTQEEGLQRSIRDNKEMVETHKKEIDELYEKKRQVIGDFKKAQSLFLQLKEERRQEMMKKKEEVKQAVQVARLKEMEEIRASVEPYQEEKNLCTALISYLQKYDALTPTTPNSVVSGSSSLSSPVTPVEPEEGWQVLCSKKCEEEDLLFVGRGRRSSKKNKKCARQSLKKKLLALTPDLLSQFSSLSITPPSTMADVPSCMEQLKVQLKYFTQLAAQEEVKMKETTSRNEEDANSISLLPPDASHLSVRQGFLLTADTSGDLDKAPTANSSSVQSSVISCASSEDGLPAMNEFEHIINTIGESGLISSNNVITYSSNACEMMDSLSVASFHDSGRSSLCLDSNVPQVNEYSDSSPYLDPGAGTSVTGSDSARNNFDSENCLHGNSSDSMHPTRTSLEEYHMKTNDKPQLSYSGIEGEIETSNEINKFRFFCIYLSPPGIEPGSLTWLSYTLTTEPAPPNFQCILSNVSFTITSPNPAIHSWKSCINFKLPSEQPVYMSCIEHAICVIYLI